MSTLNTDGQIDAGVIAFYGQEVTSIPSRSLNLTLLYL